MNKFYNYINTSNNIQELTITVAIGDKIETRRVRLNPRSVSGGLDSQMKATFGKSARILDITVSELKTSLSGDLVKTTKSLKAPTLSEEEILKKSVFLDIETTGRMGGDAINQIAVYSPFEKKGKLFLPAPNLLIQDDVSGEEALRKAQGNRPIGTIFDSAIGSHREGKLLETAYQMVKAGRGSELDLNIAIEDASGKSRANSEIFRLILNERDKVLRMESTLEDYMIKEDKFQALLFVEDQTKLEKAGIGVDPETGTMKQEYIDKRAIFRTMVEASEKGAGAINVDAITEYLEKSAGVEASEMFVKGGLEVQAGSSIRGLLARDLPQALKGKVTWIANASFEAKQFGAQIDALADEAFVALREAGEIDPELARKDFLRGFQFGKYEREINRVNQSRPGDARLLPKNPFYGYVSTISATSGDPFYPTDYEFNVIRSKALETGDFSSLYEATLKYTKEGSVRDVQDLVRAQQSMLKNMDLLDIEKPTALSVEVQSRLYGFTEQLRMQELAGVATDIDAAVAALRLKETHIAIGDVAFSEPRLLTESLDQMKALRAVQRGGLEADALIKEASAGRGAYFRALQYSALSEYFNKPSIDTTGKPIEGLEDVLYKARAGRMMLDLAESGATTVREPMGKGGFRKVEQASQEMPGLARIQQPPVAPNVAYKKIVTYDEIRSELERMVDYKNAQRNMHLENFDAQFKEFFNSDGNIIRGKEQEVASRARALSESSGDQIKAIEKKISGISSKLINDVKILALESRKGNRIEARRNYSSLRAQRSKIAAPITSASDVVQGKIKTINDSIVDRGLKGLVKKNLGKYAFGVTMLAGLSTRTSQEEKQARLLSPNYEQFLEAQSQFYGSKEEYVKQAKANFGMLEGMDEGGFAAYMRKMMSDFGSPYQGPMYSMSVLEDHQLRQERNKYIQQQFGVRHFSEKGDIGFFLSKFVSSLFRKENRIGIEMPTVISGDFQRIDSQKYSSLKGKNLIEYDFSKFDISVEDADTITIKRRGNVNSPLSAFMGTKRSGEQYKIRLAGIDAPETAHEDRAAQPYAEAAKAMLQDILSRASDVRVVTREGDTTYGRQVGMIYADGKNVNLELVRRGAAAYLPYKSKGKPTMYNEEAFEQAQTYAQDSKRGMWSTGYFQAYAEISKATGETTTFNTLANVQKVAQNSNLMSLYSIMNQAQRAGGLTANIMQDIALTSETFKYAQSKSDRSIFTADTKFSTFSEVDLQSYGYNPNSINSSLDQIMYDIGGMISDRGKNTNKAFKASTFNKNNLMLTKKSLEASELQKQEFVAKTEQQKYSEMKRYQRMMVMEEMQISANGNMFNSPINHNRM